MKLKELRKNRGLTQKQVANFLNVARSTYIAYENGVNEPDISTIKNLACFFNVSTDYLLEHNVKNVIQLNLLSPIKREIIYKTYKDTDEMALRLNAYFDLTKEFSFSASAIKKFDEI